jgi:hypothetical protein
MTVKTSANSVREYEDYLSKFKIKMNWPLAKIVLSYRQKSKTAVKFGSDASFKLFDFLDLIAYFHLCFWN